MKLLDSINYPIDLKKLSLKDFPKLAEEIREFLVHAVSKNGGHLAPSLGVVELTLILHYLYDLPNDKIAWDVGHQAYIHKMLTGRKEQLHTIRQYKGLCGFTKISESEYDSTSVGHASTSISSALGIAKARDMLGEDREVIAVIGDGAMTGGLAFEALNNLGDTNITVVLNDNEMSIAPNVGALSKYFSKIITDKKFNKLKGEVWDLLGNVPAGKTIRSVVHNVDERIRQLMVWGKFFEDMGIMYLGPIDGHDFEELHKVFQFAKEYKKGPLLVHVVTKKGKGYSPAEEDSETFHGLGKFTVDTGAVAKGGAGPLPFAKILGKTLVELAQKDKTVVGITAAMPGGTGLKELKEKIPERYYDVGIAEGHAVTFSSGLALQGMKPVVAIYSTFLQRAYDHLVHDVALQHLNVVFCIDRAGLVGADGPTHHGVLDISYLRAVPEITVMAPLDGKELRDMLYSALYHIDGPVCIRYPKDNKKDAPIDVEMEQIPLSEPRVLREGSKCALVSIGDIGVNTEKATELLSGKGIDVTHVDARFVKPLSKEFYTDLFAKHSHVVTLEHNVLPGGFGSAIMELAEELNADVNIKRMGYPDRFITHGSVPELLSEINLTAEDIASTVEAFIAK